MKALYCVAVLRSFVLHCLLPLPCSALGGLTTLLRPPVAEHPAALSLLSPYWTQFFFYAGKTNIRNTNSPIPITDSVSGIYLQASCCYFLFFGVARYLEVVVFVTELSYCQTFCHAHSIHIQDFEVVRRLRKEELAGGGRIHVMDQAALCAPRRYSIEPPTPYRYHTPYGARFSRGNCLDTPLAFVARWPVCPSLGC